MSKGLKVAVAIMALFLAFSITLCSIFIKERNDDEIPAGKNESFIADDKPGGILNETSSLYSSSEEESSSDESAPEGSSEEESSSKGESSSKSESSSKAESSSSPTSSSRPESSSSPTSSSRPESSSAPSSSSRPESSSAPSSSSRPESSSAPSSSTPPVSSAPAVNDYHYILGTSEKTATQLANYVLRYNPNVEATLTCTIYELAQYYIEEGAAEGVRGDVAFCQAIKETGWFRYGGDVAWTQNNFCGLAAVGGGASGASFASARIGVRAHIQHLKGYATTGPLNAGTPVYERWYILELAGRRGCAQKWVQLNGKWAIPGNGYGERILAIYENI